MHTGSEQVLAEDGGDTPFYNPVVAAIKLQLGLWYPPARSPTEKYTRDYSPTSVRMYYGGTRADAANALSMPKQPRPVRTLLDVAMEQEAMRTCTQQAETENGK